MITEDIIALAVFKTGRPVKRKYTRSEQLAASTSRHPMRVTVKLGVRMTETPFKADCLYRLVMNAAADDRQTQP